MRVVNASPLIVLSKLGRLDLLRASISNVEVVTPRAVLEEVLKGKPDDPAVALVVEASGDWLRVLPAPSVPAALRAGGLDSGELAVLSLALENPGSEVVLDDHSARRAAMRL